MKSKLDEYRSFLSIDKNDLDTCLMEQPEIYFKVADALVMAEAERDAVQLDFDELQAELDQDVRAKVAKEDKRLTDKAIEQKLRTLPKVQDLHRQLLAKKNEAKHWKALEKSFDQRADMLKTLVSLHLRSTYGYALEAGVGQARTGLIDQKAEQNRAATNALRRTRRSMS